MSSEKTVKTVSKNTTSSAPKTTSSAPKQKTQTVNTPQHNATTKTLQITDSKSVTQTTNSQSGYSQIPENQTSSYEEYLQNPGPSEEEEEYIEGAPYKATEYERRLNERELKDKKSNETNVKAQKSAAQAIATYYGGQAGNAIASAVNNSGIADPIYENVAKKITMMNKIAPGGRIGQEILNKLDDEGIVDKAGDAIDSIGSKGSGTATKEAGKQAGKQTGKEAAKKAGEETAKQNAKKQAAQQAASNASQKSTVTKKNDNILWQIFKRHPLICLGVAGFFLIFIMILLIILGAAGGDDEGVYGYVDPEYDFTETVVTLTDASGHTTLETLMLEDLVLGAAYTEIYDAIKHLESNEKAEVYKSFLIVAKSLALSMGNYNSTTKEITIASSTNNGLPYCDINAGCRVYNNNGVYTYVSANYNGSLTGSIIKNIEAMPEDEKEILEKAYEETKSLILTPSNLNTALTEYTYGNVAYSQKIKQEWIDAASEGETYIQLITGTQEYKGKKIYNIDDYATYYTYADGSAYWWPIGGSSEVDGIYSGQPTVTYVSSVYGWRTVDGKRGYHKGIDIAGACQSNIVVATRSGTVRQASDGCASMGSYGSSCGGGYGNYVIVDHGDGTSSVYAHMYKNSVAVKVGDTVKQGEKLGLIGSSGSSTGCHLYFEIRVNNEQVNPLEYISASNPRPTINVSSGYAEGNGNKQTVCLSLKQSGFSNNAVAAIMVNMQAESSFRITALGDNGTSYGLCQWHNGRYSRLKSYCGSEYSTVKCQLSYLIYELQNSYKGVYNYLLTNNSTWNMANYYCMYFEVPANRERSCKTRADKYANTYSSYVQNGCR